ncbi:MAG: hypothetical protein U0929_18075 [Planctomycetaceae bacterium]
MISHFSALFGIYLVVAMTLMGCGVAPESPSVECLDPKQSKTWLLSEVDETFKSQPNAAFRFPIANRTDHPITVRVRSIGCSCYRVKHGETRLKVDDPVEIGAGATEVFSLSPPRPAFDSASDYSFSLEYEAKPGAPTSVINCQGVLNSIADVRVNPTVLTAEFVHDSPAQAVLMEVTRTARVRGDATAPIVTRGWPEGTQVDEPVAIGEVTQVLDGLWKQTWRVTARVPKPSLTANPQEVWPIQVSGTRPDSPQNQAQLMIRFRSGLSGPRLVHLGDVQVGQSVTRRVQILARDEQPFRILGPSDPNEVLSLSSESSSASKAHWSNLTMNAREPGDFRQVMQVVTDHPQQANLAIEVRAHIVSPVSTTAPASPAVPSSNTP